jgi:2-keto-4-pentenoate hydratase
MPEPTGATAGAGWVSATEASAAGAAEAVHEALRDPRIAAGMAAQRTMLDRLRTEGATVIGFKAGFGSSGAFELLRIDAPLIGFLTDHTLLASGPAAAVGAGATADLTGWHQPVAEAEVAVLLGRDLPADVDGDSALRAVSAVAPAIELADLDLTPSADVVTDILGGDIYHRHVLLGEQRATPAGWPGAELRATVTHAPGADGTAPEVSQEVSQVDDVEAVPGSTAAVLIACARMAAALGRGLRRGDVVILGSVVPPVRIGPAATFRMELAGHPAIEVRTAG